MTMATSLFTRYAKFSKYIGMGTKMKLCEEIFFAVELISLCVWYYS